MDAGCSFPTAQTKKQMEYADKAGLYTLSVSLCVLKTHRKQYQHDTQLSVS